MDLECLFVEFFDCVVDFFECEVAVGEFVLESEEVVGLDFVVVAC